MPKNLSKNGKVTPTPRKHETKEVDKTIIRQVLPKKKKRSKQRFNENRWNILPSSKGFIKCCFANPDYRQTGFRGIPDGSKTSLFVYDHLGLWTVTIAAGKTRNILLTPTPGYAFLMTGDLSDPYVTGTSQENYMELDGYHFQGFDQLLQEAYPSSSAFRIAGQTIEITNVTPSLHSGGAMKCTGLNISETVFENGNELNPHTLESSLTGYPDNQGIYWKYCNNSKRGIFTLNLHENARNWGFTPLRVEGNTSTLDLDGEGYARAIFKKGYFGVAPAMSSRLIQITAPADNGQTFTIRAQQCVEYVPRADTVYEQLQSGSPDMDPLALETYNQIAKDFPIAVTRDENAGIMDMIKGLAAPISSAIQSIFPGTPAAHVAGAVHALTSK